MAELEGGLRLSLTASQLLISQDVLAWLVFAVVAMALAAFEIAGLRSAWRLHTISWYAYKHPWLRRLILVLFLLAALWWVIHSGHPHPA